MMLGACAVVPGQRMGANDKIRVVRITDIAADDETVPTTPLPPALLAYRPESYLIGAGDRLDITVSNHPELSRASGLRAVERLGRLVRTDGRFFFPYAGLIQAEGQTSGQIRSTLAQRMSRFMETPQVDVTVSHFASHWVSFRGAFANRQPQPITATPLTLAKAVDAAGIKTEDADISHLVLTRDGKPYVLDLNTMETGDDRREDIVLKGGDMLYLPRQEAQEVFVLGEVVRPLAITLRTKLTLAQALGRAGGLNQETAAAAAVYVIRNTPDQEVGSMLYLLDARSPRAFGIAGRFVLRAGDIVFASASGIARWHRFARQLLPFTSIVRNATLIQGDLTSR